MGVLHKRGEKTKDLLWKADMDEKWGEIISKGGLISESFSIWVQISKNGCQIITLSTIHLKKRCTGKSLSEASVVILWVS